MPWTAEGVVPSLDAFLSGTAAWEAKEQAKAFMTAWTAAAVAAVVDSCLDQGLNLSQFALRQHSFLCVAV